MHSPAEVPDAKFLGSNTHSSLHIPVSDMPPIQDLGEGLPSILHLNISVPLGP